MTFTPQDQTFAEAAEAYRRLWADEGSRITEAIEHGAGLTFVGRNIPAVIFEGPIREMAVDQIVVRRDLMPGAIASVGPGGRPTPPIGQRARITKNSYA